MGIFILFLILEGKLCAFHHMMLDLGLSYSPFIMSKYVPSMHNLLRISNHEKRLNSLHNFSVSIEMLTLSNVMYRIY